MILLNVRAVVVDLCTVIPGIPQRFYPAAVCTLIFRPPLLVSGGDNNINGHADFSRGVVNRQIIGVSVLVQTAEDRDQLRRCDQHILFRRLWSFIHIEVLVLEADRVILTRLIVTDDRSSQIKAMNDLNDLVFDFSADQTPASIHGIIQNAGQIKLWLFLNHLDVLTDPFGGAYAAEHGGPPR